KGYIVLGKGESAFLAHPAAPPAMPAAVLVDDKRSILEINSVERADAFTLLAERTCLGIPLESHFAVTMHSAPTFFPAMLSMARTHTAHGKVLECTGITGIDVPFGVGADDHGRYIVNGGGNGDLTEDRACLDENAVLAEEAVGQHERCTAGEMVQSILIGNFQVVQSHDPDRVGDEGLGAGALDGFHHFPDHDRRNNPEGALRSPMGFDRDPLTLFDPVREIHLFNQCFEFSWYAVAVIPSEGTGRGKIDFRH